MCEFEYLTATMYLATKNGHKLREPTIKELDDLYIELENKKVGEQKEIIEEFVYTTLTKGVENV